MPQVYDGHFDFNSSKETHYPLPYPWEVIDEWAVRLKAMRLIYFGSGDARGGFGQVGSSSLGKFLLHWITADRPLDS